MKIPEVLEDAENTLTASFHALLVEFHEETVHHDERIAKLEQKLQAICLQNKDCQRLLTIPGIGLLSATAIIKAVS